MTPENAAFWLGFAGGVVVALVVIAIFGLLTEPRPPRDPYGEPWQ